MNQNHASRCIYMCCYHHFPHFSTSNTLCNCTLRRHELASKTMPKTVSEHKYRAILLTQYQFRPIGGSTTLSYFSGWSPDVMSQRIVVATFLLNCLEFSGTRPQHPGTVIPAVYTAHLLCLYSSEWI